MKPTLEVKLTRTPEGILAQYLDRPEIIVTGKDKKEITAKLKAIISGYIEAFPETRGDFFGTGGRMRAVSFV